MDLQGWVNLVTLILSCIAMTLFFASGHKKLGTLWVLIVILQTASLVLHLQTS